MDFILSGGEFPIADLTCGYRSLGEYCQAQLSKHADQVLLVNISNLAHCIDRKLLYFSLLEVNSLSLNI